MKKQILKTIWIIVQIIMIPLISVVSIRHNTYATESTLTLTINNSTVRADVAPVNSSGTFKKATASTITAATNNATGYTLSISAPAGADSDYDKLINSTDSTAKIYSISSPTTEEQYKALNATSYNNTWGYLPNKYCSDGTSTSCVDNTRYLPAPTITGDVIDQTSSANTVASTYTLSVGTRIDSNTKTGKYSNSFVVKLVANAIPYTIFYDGNVVSNMPMDVSSTTPNPTVNIASNLPTRTGYKFLGWCTVAPANNEGTDLCVGGTTYQPGASLTISQTGTGNDFRLYAMWEILTIANSTYLQEVQACPSTLATNQVYTIRDSRDNTEYHAAKLADGKCWLLDNLALDLANSTILNSLSASNTNIDMENDPGALDALKGVALGTISDKYATAMVSNNWTSTDLYSAPLVNLSDKNTIPTDATSTAGGYKIGGYYNYCAASAGSYCYGDGASEGVSSGDSTSDICPKGWRMPTGDAPGEYSALSDAINGYGGSISTATAYDNYRAALHLPLSGFISSGETKAQGGYGVWWSSTRCSDFSMFDLRLVAGSSLFPIDNTSRSTGASVRCVLEP